MVFLYLSPNFPDNFSPFVSNLAHSGATVLGLGSESFYTMPDALRSAQTEYYQVSSLENREEVFSAVSYFHSKYGTIDIVDSLQEHWIALEAAIREKFGIPGITPESLAKLRRKSGMKEIFVEAGANVAPGEIVSSFEQACSFLERFGPRAVIKPNEGVGAWNTFLVTSKADLEHFFAKQDDCVYFIESFIEGELLSFDGLVDLERNIVFRSAMVFPLPIMDVVHQDLALYYYTLRDIPPDLEEAGRDSVSRLDLRGRFFHLEFFRSYHGNKYTALEANLRPPGLLTTDMWNFAHDFDIYHGWAETMSKRPWQHFEQPPWHVIYISRKWHHRYVHTEEQLRTHFGDKLCLEAYIPEVFSPVGGNKAFLLRAPGISELLDCREFALRQLS